MLPIDVDINIEIFEVFSASPAMSPTERLELLEIEKTLLTLFD